MQVLRIAAVEQKIGLRHTKIYKMIQEGDFPKPVALGPRAVGWIESEIDQWLRDRVAARDEAA